MLFRSEGRVDDEDPRAAEPVPEDEPEEPAPDGTVGDAVQHGAVSLLAGAKGQSAERGAVQRACGGENRGAKVRDELVERARGVVGLDDLPRQLIKVDERQRVGRRREKARGGGLACGGMSGILTLYSRREVLSHQRQCRRSA